jgi:hypothetical protein
MLFTKSRSRNRHSDCGRSPPWTAVAAATAFGLRLRRQRRMGRRKKGGSCCYRSPRRFAQVYTKTCAKCTARQSRNQSRAMAILAMLGHGQDARGTKSSRVTKNLGISSTTRRSRNQSRAMAILAMLGHGQDARGTKSSRREKKVGNSSTALSLGSREEGTPLTL